MTPLPVIGPPCREIRCTECCRGELLVLMPDEDHTQYETVQVADGYAIRPKSNLDCWYLDRATGCTIYDRRPLMCREFDCVKAYKARGRIERKLKKKIFAVGIRKAARKCQALGYDPEP